MEYIDIVKAYFAALDSANAEQVTQYLSDDYQLVDFASRPMGKEDMLSLISELKTAMPDLRHSLSNISVDKNVVRLTVQRSGTNSGNLDLRRMGIGVVPRTHKFIIFQRHV